jgi:hypothetical protein
MKSAILTKQVVLIRRTISLNFSSNNGIKSVRSIHYEVVIPFTTDSHILYFSFYEFSISLSAKSAYICLFNEDHYSLAHLL